MLGVGVCASLRTKDLAVMIMELQDKLVPKSDGMIWNWKLSNDLGVMIMELEDKLVPKTDGMIRNWKLSLIIHGFLENKLGWSLLGSQELSLAFLGWQATIAGSL